MLMNIDYIDDVSSEKVCLHHLRQCCSLGGCVKSNNAQDNIMCQTLSAVNGSDSRNFPWVLRNELLRGTAIKYQVVKVAMHEPFSELGDVILELRQRQVQDV